MAQKPMVSVDEAAVEQEINAVSAGRNKQEKLTWLKDAGFGLFIHWSADVQLGCVISHTLVGSSKEYADRYFAELPRTFNPDRWDAARVARLAKIAGVQYAVFTAKHHSGFCMWDTKSTDFNIMNTPYGKDIVRQYADAFRAEGLKVGLYFSPEDFKFLYDHGQLITRTPTTPYNKEVMDAYRAYLTVQMTELMTLFGPIDLIFFDGGEMMKDENGESLQTLCKNLAWDLQPDILVTRGAIPTPEQHLPGVGMEETWEACLTLSSAWGYQPTNEVYKTGEEAIKLLMNTRALGGSLLLNIGPDSNGEICAQQEGLLREIGLWNFINREAVLNVRPWSLAREGDMILLSDKPGTTLYAVVTGQKDWNLGMRREFVVKSARATAETQVSVLGASGEVLEYRPDVDARSYFEQKDDGLHVLVMNSQRIYCGLQWRNPLVIRMTNVEKAFSPMGIRTDAETLRTENGSAELHAEILSMGSFDRAEVSFEWRVYPGFAMAAREDGWKKSRSVGAGAPGNVCVRLEGLEKGVTYQYHAVIENDMNRMQGENALFVCE